MMFVTLKNGTRINVDKICYYEPYGNSKLFPKFKTDIQFETFRDALEETPEELDSLILQAESDQITRQSLISRDLK